MVEGDFRLTIVLLTIYDIAGAVGVGVFFKGSKISQTAVLVFVYRFKRQ